MAEFDENIPWDEREAELRKERDEVSQVEMELAMIDKEVPFILSIYFNTLFFHSIVLLYRDVNGK